jgi:hypothetical protein
MSVFDSISLLVDAIFNSLKDFAGLSATEFITHKVKSQAFPTAQHSAITHASMSFPYQFSINLIYLSTIVRPNGVNANPANFIC